MLIKPIKFDLSKFRLYEKLKAKQGDTESRFLLFQLLDGSLPFDLENRSVRAYMIKPDGNEVFNDLIINDRVKGYCTLELTNQVLAAPGIVKLELMVTEGTKKLTSSVFELEVDKSINSEKSIVSTNEFGALLKGLASLNEYDNYKNEIAEARGGQTNLKKRLDGFDAHLDNKARKDICVNVKDFGAKGDGVTDDTISIKRAVDYLLTSNYNGELFFPPGIYLISYSIDLYKNGCYYTIRGCGRRNTTIKAIANMEYMFKLNEGNFSYVEFCISEIGVNLNNYANCGIDGFFANYTTLYRVSIITNKENSTLIKLSGWGNRIENCLFIGNYDNTFHDGIVPATALLIDNNLSTNNLIIEKNVFAKLSNAIISNDYINDAHLSGNIYDNIGKILVSTKGCRNLTFEKNYCEACGGNNKNQYILNPIEYKYNTYERILNSAIIIHEDIGLVTNNINNVTIINNQFANCFNDKLIALSLCTNVKIEGNDFYSTYNYKNVVYIFGKGIQKNGKLTIENHCKNIEKFITYDNDTSNYFFNYGDVTIFENYILTHKSGWLTEEAKINGVAINKYNVTVNDTNVLTVKFKIDVRDIENPVLLKFDYEKTSDKNLFLDVYRKDNTNIVYQLKITNNNEFIYSLQEELKDLKQNEFYFRLKGDSDIKINSILLVTSNSYNKIIELI